MHCFEVQISTFKVNESEQEHNIISFMIIGIVFSFTTLFAQVGTVSEVKTIE